VNRTFQQAIGDTSMICVPLFHGDTPVAVLNVMSTSETERLDEDDRRMLELLAVGLSAAVSRAAEFRAKARFEAVFASALTGMMVMDLDGTIISVNPAMEDLLGHPASAIEGARPDAFVHEDDREATVDRAKRVLAGEMRSTLEHRYVRADGGVVWVDVSLSLVPATEGGGEGFIIARPGSDAPQGGRDRAARPSRAQPAPSAARRAHRASEPHALPRPHRPGAAPRSPLGRQRRRADARPRPLQGGQRLARPRGRRRVADRDRPAAGRMLRASDTVARLGGDEFGVLLPDQTCTETSR
jgi:PAS domain S-box-containing protein